MTTSDGAEARDRARVRFAVIAVCAASMLPYLSTLDDYFVRDDFGVVQLLAQKPASYFPRWFYTSWMDHIWGYTPDEIRPFPAVSYQLTALGGATSPVLHHALNILLHAVNGLLVFGIARAAGMLGVTASAFAAVLFVLLPIHTESVAWITGRVDSMPALFYLASFLAYVRWRRTGSAPLYAGAVALFFVALFTKQNTITMVGTLAAYDVLVLRRPLLPITSFVTPYVPFALLTGGYLWLRYLLFGEVAREGALNPSGLAHFLELLDRHLAHMVIGDYRWPRLPSWLVLVAVCATAVVIASRREARRSRVAARLLFFGPVWWLIGVAPVLVAGYASPRHVYLAAVGWAMALGILFDAARRMARDDSRRRAVSLIAAAVLLLYLPPLALSVREWNVTAAVSQKIVRDVRAEVLAAPEGTLIIVGAPTRSWDWALPFSVRPPFTRTDLTERAVIVFPRSLSCCTAPWFGDTKHALERWAASGARESAVILRWDLETGELSRSSTADNPQVPAVARALLTIERPEDLDRNLLRIIDVFAGTRHPRAGSPAP